MLPASAGRLDIGTGFSYKILAINVDTLNSKEPKMVKVFSPMYTSLDSKTDIFSEGSSEKLSVNYFMANQNSALISRNGLDTYIFAVTGTIEGDMLNTVKSKLIFVDVMPTDTSSTIGNTFGYVFAVTQLDSIAQQSMSFTAMLWS